MAPRDVKTAKRSTFVIAAIGFLPFAVFAVMLRSDLRARDGPRADARVVEVLHLRQRSKGPPETSAVRVVFSPRAGGEVTALVRTTRRTIAVGDGIRISYAADDPARVRAVDGTEMAWRVPLILAATAWFLALCAGWVWLRLSIGRPPATYRPSPAP